VQRREHRELADATARLADELPDRYSPERVGARAASLLPT
jgi:hypothetical protein